MELVMRVRLGYESLKVSSYEYNTTAASFGGLEPAI
jgi:hypothetical protein